MYKIVPITNKEFEANKVTTRIRWSNIVKRLKNRPLKIIIDGTGYNALVSYLRRMYNLEAYKVTNGKSTIVYIRRKK